MARAAARYVYTAGIGGNAEAPGGEIDRGDCGVSGPCHGDRLTQSRERPRSQPADTQGASAYEFLSASAVALAVAALTLAAALCRACSRAETIRSGRSA